MPSLDQLSEKLARLNSFRPLEPSEIAQLDEQTKYEHVWSSNALEGTTLTLSETEYVLSTGFTISKKPVRDYLDTIDLSHAFDLMKDLASSDHAITLRDIRDLNRLVTYNTSRSRTEAGKIRGVNVRPAGGDPHTYAPFEQVPTLLEGFIEWLHGEAERLHPVERAALAHCKFVSIHPFIDGNGRTSRLLMNFELIRGGYPIINIQPDAEHRREYIDALQAGHGNDRPSEFVALVTGYVDRALDERIGILAGAETRPEYPTD